MQHFTLAIMNIHLYKLHPTGSISANKTLKKNLLKITSRMLTYFRKYSDTNNETKSHALFT